MKRRAALHCHVSRTGSAACVIAFLLFGLAGCLGDNQILRPQKAEETERERYGVKTLGEFCEVSDVDPKPVGGIGIVTGLDGTGGDSPHDENRGALEKLLRQKGCTEFNALFHDKSCALVIVSGQIPPGIHTGEHFDVEVTLPPGSKATSLRGGVLENCTLYTYDYARGPFGGVSTVKGHPLAAAEGSLQLSLGKTDGDADGERFRTAHVWNGGRSKIDNTIGLLLTADQQFSRVSAQLAARINETYSNGGEEGVKLATPFNKTGVILRVPPAYRLNIPHYLRVVRLIPWQDSGDEPGAGTGQPKSYRQRLAEDVRDPARTVTSALRLEALGQKSVPALKLGLESDNPLVCFCCAEALTYLGHGAGAMKLADFVEHQPFLRSYGLSALASLDENVTRMKLQELLEKGTVPDVRYGAFRALQALDAKYPLTQGQELNKALWLHCVAPKTPSLIHLCTMKRSEVVLFGEDPQFVPPFALESNGYTVTAHGKDDDRCIVCVVPKHGKVIRQSCSLKVREVLQLLTRLDATYPEVVEILLDAENGKQLSCPVALNALPEVLPVEALAKAGKDGKIGEILLEVGNQDLGATPTLYERPLSRVPRQRDAETKRKPEAPAVSGPGE